MILKIGVNNNAKNSKVIIKNAKLPNSGMGTYFTNNGAILLSRLGS